jgi:hypothetical protein
MNTTTKLQAVNTLLISIGEEPVNALGLGLEDQTVAENILEEVSRKLQIKGWSWNTERNYTISRQSDGTLTVPYTFLSVDFQSTQYVLRGNRVYDKVNHSYVLTANPTCTSVILGLDWDEIPEAGRQYIMYSSGRIFQARQVGSRILHEFSRQDEHDAWLTLRSNEEATANLSIFNNPEVSMALDRSSGRAVVDYPAGTIFGIS